MLKNPFRQSRFLTGARDARHLPGDLGREIAIAGRSNVGKSSLINVLTDNRKLARTSKTPGRTREINFFEVAPGVRIADLPGYGWARVDRGTRATWEQLLDGYLRGRHSLCGMVLIMDARHPLQETDQQMFAVLSAAAVPARVVLGKADKLRSGEARQAVSRVEAWLAAQGRPADTVQLFSSRTRAGLEELCRHLCAWLWPANPAG